MWTFSGRSCRSANLVAHGHKGHQRMVFTLTAFDGGTKLLTTSMDRNIILWDIMAEPLSNNGNSTCETTNMTENFTPGN